MVMINRRSDGKNIVWFGAVGKNEDNSTIFFNKNNKHDNYSENQEAIKDTLTQRLSVIKEELWYNVNYGIPLFEKYKSKGIIDSYVIKEILNLENVKNILEFSSQVNNNNYYLKVKINTSYGIIEINI